MFRVSGGFGVYRILNMNPQKGTTLGPMGRQSRSAVAAPLWRQLGAFEPLKNADPGEKAEFYKCSAQVKDWPGFRV